MLISNHNVDGRLVGAGYFFFFFFFSFFFFLSFKVSELLAAYARKRPAGARHRSRHTCDYLAFIAGQDMPRHSTPGARRWGPRRATRLAPRSTQGAAAVTPEEWSVARRKAHHALGRTAGNGATLNTIMQTELWSWCSRMRGRDDVGRRDDAVVRRSCRR